MPNNSAILESLPKYGRRSFLFGGVLVNASLARKIVLLILLTTAAKYETGEITF